jgi:zinc protease
MRINQFFRGGLSLAIAASIASCATPSGTRGGAGGPQATGIGYKLRPFEEKTLENGLRILYIPDESLPYVSYTMLLGSGSAQDPEGQEGISAFVAEMLDKGTRKRSAPQIADELGKLGADFDASASVDYTTVTLSGLANQADQLLSNLVEVVTEPAFTDTEIERTRKNILAQLERRMDQPEGFASVAWEEFLYGTHPYANPTYGRIKTVRELKKKNLIQHYLRFYRPNNTILAVVGKFTPELRKRVETEFGSWEKREIPAPQFPVVAPIKGLEILVADKPGLTQSQVRLGALGIKRQNPDFLAIRVANTILGGAFASRLNDRIRKELGLTYGIHSLFEARETQGPFEISTFTKNQSVGQTVTETMKLLRDFKDKGVNREEVERAKGYLKGVFPTAIETPEKLAFNLLILRRYGIPDTYLTNYLSDIDALSVGDINRVIKTYIDDRNLKLLVYSNAQDVLPQLEPLGKVEVKKASELQ